MAFKVVFIAHTPDAEPEKHQCVVETSKYKLLVRLVKNQDIRGSGEKCWSFCSQGRWPK